MTSTTCHPRTAALRRAGWWLKAPRVVLAGVLWLVVIEAAQGVAAWALLAVVVMGTVASLAAETLVVRVLWWARRPAAPLGVPGDAQVVVLVTGRHAAGIGLAGRRHLVVPAGWVGRADLPALLVEARVRQLVSAGRFEVAYLWFSWPWQLLASFAGGVARGVAWLPLVGFAWRIRIVVAAIAVWQSVTAGRSAAAIGLVVVVALSFLLPWTRAHHQRLVRQAMADLQSAGGASAQPRRGALPAASAPVAGAPRRRPQEGRGAAAGCGRRRPAVRLGSCGGGAIRGCVHGRRSIGTKGA